MKVKCIKAGCGNEFEPEENNTFFETIDEGDILFEIDKEIYNVIGYATCPVCGSQCVEIEDNPLIHEFKILGYEAIEKTAKAGSNTSGRVWVPIDWIGKRVMVVRLE